MVGWHHRLSGHEFEQAQGDSEGQESLTCCSPWGRKQLDMTKQLNNKDEKYKYITVLNIKLYCIETNTT